MTLPVLLYCPGSHGNFLSKCLSVASGVVEDFDFYGNKKGAHSNNSFKRVVNHVHWSEHKDIFCYIEIDTRDQFILFWHNYFATNEFGLDLLTLTSFDSLQEFIDKEKSLSSPLLDIYRQDGVLGVREFLKKRFYDHQEWQDKIKHDHNIKNIFKFSWFYNKKMFCKEIKNLCIELGYNYKVDVSHHQQEFLDRKQNIIESKKLVEHAFKCYTSNTSMDISNFCIYEQSYLDYLIEQHLGYEIENWQEYPKNTKNINPVKAWKGVKYEL